MDQIATVVAIAFWVLLLSGGVLIMLSGNRPAQFFLGAILGATILTVLTDIVATEPYVDYAFCAIDGGLLFLVMFCVFKTDSFWPIWFAGFHSIAVASDLSSLVFTETVPAMYVNVGSFFAVPALLTMVVGVTLDQYFAPPRPDDVPIPRMPR